MTTSLLAALAVALTELDAAHAGQFMISRPIVFGPILGYLLGNAAQGVLLGLLFEMFSLEDVPVGANVVPSVTFSAGAAILLALAPPAVPLELAIPAGLLLGRAHRLTESALRRRRESLAHEAVLNIADGENSALGSALRRGIAEHCAATAALLLVALVAFKPLLVWIWPALPDAVRSGFEWGMILAPWLAAATLLRVLISPAMREA